MNKINERINILPDLDIVVSGSIPDGMVLAVDKEATLKSIEKGRLITPHINLRELKHG